MSATNRLIWVGLFTFYAGLAQSALDAATPPSVEEFRHRVVRVRGLAEGFGWIVGERGALAYIVTANHVVRNEDGELGRDTGVEFYDDQGRWHAATPLSLFVASPQDLAVLTARKPGHVAPRGACATTDLDDYRLEVWFIGRDGRWYIPAVPGGISVTRPTMDHLLKVDITTVRPGTSGAPLLTESGLIGMLINDTGASEAEALSVGFIRERFEDWNLPWLLEPCRAPQDDLAAIRAIVAEHFEVPPDAIELDTPLSEQAVQADWFDEVEIILAVEEQLGVSIFGGGGGIGQEELNMTLRPYGRRAGELSVGLLARIVSDKKSP